MFCSLMKIYLIRNIVTLLLKQYTQFTILKGLDEYLVV